MKYYNDVKAALKQIDENIVVTVTGTVISEYGVYCSVKAEMPVKEAVQYLENALLKHGVFFVKGKGYGFFWDNMPEELSWGA